ncbi:hypothetical protein [Micromonospora zamorensis]|uniref:hypothetical protein n=1 Tax=Micromonospora zamorensis TaxID=709883 RepID=UPI000B5ADB28|nr:hypothetical protein [Micromonospora zamorensis]
MAGPGMFLYQGAGSDSMQPNAQVYDLAARTMVADGVALLVPDSAFKSPTLRAYLRDVVAGDGRLVVVPFGQEDSGLLPLESAVRAQDMVGIVIGVPGSAVQGGVPTGLGARLVPVESTAELGTPARSAAAYRLLPEALVANRRKLAELARADQQPSVTKLVSYSATGGSRTAGGDDFAAGDLSPLAGVYHARFGDLPNLPLAQLLVSTSPLSRPHLTDALGLHSMPMPLANVLREFESGRAAAALVHAPSDSPTPGSFWVVKDDAGQLLWASGTEPVAPVVLDGAVDPRVAVLEHPYSEFVVVAPDGSPYRPELPAEPTWTPRVSANARRTGNTILLGPDRPSAVSEEIMAALERYDGPSILVNVRRGARSGHGSTLDKLIAESLHHTLAKNPAITLVVATESNDELKFIVADQHGRSSVQPTMKGFERVWDVQGARSPHGETYPSLTPAFGRALALADPPKAVPSELVANLITQPTWVAAEEYLKQFSADLVNRQVAGELTGLESASVANGERPSRSGNGKIKDSPFYRPDRTLPAFRVLIEQELRAQGDPKPDGGPPLEPQHARITEPIEPHTRTADSSLSLGYLTARGLDAAHLGEEVGDYMTGLLWLRELMRAATDVDKTKFSLADARAVVGAKGELEEERAARRPHQPEIFRAHAAVVEAIAKIIAVGGVDANWRELIKAADCLTGTDRLAWHFIFRHVIAPSSEPERAAIKRMQEYLVTCHDKAGV